MDYAPRGTRAIDHFILALVRVTKSRVGDPVRVLDRAHAICNRSEYEGDVSVDERLLDAVIKACELVVMALGRSFIEVHHHHRKIDPARRRQNVRFLKDIFFSKHRGLVLQDQNGTAITVLQHGTVEDKWDDYAAFWTYHPDDGMRITIYIP